MKLNNRKSWMSFLAMASVTLFLAACGKDGGGGGQQIATTPPVQCNIPGVTNCNPQAYQQTGLPGYNYQNTFQNGYCGCPAGYRPIMNPQWGLGCAPQNSFQGYSFYGWGSYSTWSGYAHNNSWLNIPQNTYQPALSGAGQNCYTDAGYGCDVRVANSCGNNGFCRAVGGGSTVGICSYGSGSNYDTSYGTPYYPQYPNTRCHYKWYGYVCY